MRAEVLAVGSELLTSAHIDTNSLFITERLNELGIELQPIALIKAHLRLAGVDLLFVAVPFLYGPVEQRKIGVDGKPRGFQASAMTSRLQSYTSSTSPSMYLHEHA